MTGRIAEKRGYLFAVINYKDNFGKYKQKWIPTGLKERGNKKEAQKILDREMENFNPNTYADEEAQKIEPQKDIMFVDYIADYLNAKKKELSPNVFKGYMNNYKIMKAYFGNKLKLKDVTYHHLEDYYKYLIDKRNNKNITVKHHAVILSPALRLAYRDNLIPKNPYEFMPKIKREKTRRKYYDQKELETLFKYSDKTPIGLVVRIAAFYGFRRSEILGLKWQSVDFERKTITIENKVLDVDATIYVSSVLKTIASNRTLPLLPEIEALLKKRQKEIEHNKKIYGLTYNHKYDDFICVNDLGDLLLPNYITQLFRKVLKRNNLKLIRFHDLRHSCASLLVANGVPMKNIQEWLGHSNFNTTADVYSHLDFSSKIQSASVISKALTEQDDEENEKVEVADIKSEIAKLEEMLKEKEKKLKNKQDEM